MTYLYESKDKLNVQNCIFIPHEWQTKSLHYKGFKDIFPNQIIRYIHSFNSCHIIKYSALFVYIIYNILYIERAVQGILFSFFYYNNKSFLLSETEVSS